MIAVSDPPDTEACACCLPRRGFLRRFAGAGAATVLASRAMAEGSRYTGLVIDCHGH